MKDLKIRVANEAESKEAQELFFELGAKWRSQINREEAAYVINTEYPSIILHGGDMSLNWNTIEQFNSLSYYKEITLQELRDMVNPMKEYLEKQADGSYKLVMRGIVGRDDGVEVPEWANYAYNNDQGVCFLKDELGFNHPLLLWQRHTQPEELPFVDDNKPWAEQQMDRIMGRESLNDQYAEIEQVRQQTDSLPEFKHDFVNHPKHYCGHPSGIECIEITRHHDFAIGNAIKYLWRVGLKDSDNEIQDLKKAVWYIQDKISQLENK